MGLGSSKTGQLTREELDRVTGSWKVIMENPEENGIIIFKTKQFPFIIVPDLFGPFVSGGDAEADKSEDCTAKQDENGNPRGLEPGDTVLTASDDPLSTDSCLLWVGHSWTRQNEKELKKELKEVILEILTEELKLPEESLNAWNKTLDIAFLYIFEGLRGDEKHFLD